MSESLDKFVSLLLRAELITQDQLQAVRKQLAVEGQVTADDNLAQLLADSGHLTEFQATEIQQGKIDHLIVGDYLILHPVGKGGMGQVYKARHSVMKREVAVKFTLPNEDGRVDQNAIDRFQREVEAASKLSHPNIVSSLDAGKRGEVCYLVMEYVRGMNLTNYVRENGPMSFRQALDCTLQAAQGLEYAHSKGVVHRDIKPSNLLITTDGQVKVLDMGLARNAYDDQSREPRKTDVELTHSGQLLGTVDFMAPEQAIDPRLSDGRADIYSLGCTLYFLLTGQLPFRRDGRTTMSRIIAHRETPIPSICKERVDVPASFERVFQKMMAKQVGKRYQSVSELIFDLRKAQLDVQSMKQRMAETETIAERKHRRPLSRWGIAAALIAIPLCIIYGAYLVNRPANGPQAQRSSSNEQPAPPAASGPVDLLQTIDLSRHVLAGTDWQLSQGRLIVPSSVPSKLSVPAAFPPEFRLHLTVKRISGDGPFVLGISEEGRRFYVLIDAARKGGDVRLTALGTKAGRMIITQENVLSLHDDRPVELLLLVGSDMVALQADEVAVLEWQGDFRDLSLGGGWGLGDGNSLLIGSNDEGSFEISRLELISEPASGLPKPNSGSD